MLKKTSYVLIIALFSFSSAANAVPLASPISDTADDAVIADALTTPQPPRAQKKPKRLKKFGDLRVDNYYWLNERSNSEVIDYLKAENDYTQAVTAPTQALRATLFEEIKGRIPQTDQSVPYRVDNYFYYDRVEEGKQYPIFARKRGDLEAPEQILLDVNALAKGYEYFEIGDWEVSSGENLLAYAADTAGRRIYTIRFKDLNTGEILKDEITAATDNIVWAEDNQTLFYAMQDAETLRPDRIYRHKVGTPSSEDVLVYEEEDEQFYAYVSKTKSKAYVIVGVSQTLSDELHYLPADKPQSELQIFQARERGHEYSIEHYGDSFYILTNSGGAENFRLMQTPVDATAKSNWTELIPHRKEVLLEDFEIFDDYLVLEERINGLIQLRIRPWTQPESEYQIDFGEPAYSAGIDINPSFDSSTLRYNYTSMTTPHSVLDFDMTSRKATLLKRQQIGAGFDPEAYRTERLFAPAQDGTQIPGSLVYKKGAKLDGTRPLLLYGYGAYGNSLDAGFSGARLSLLDRGFVYAIAHVRGGEELGRSWYEQGKLLDKQNSFTDFIACGEYLIREGYADPQRLYAMGSSAGGLLMGAIANMRPDLWAGIVTGVPFVDVLTTMLDETIPLTTSEYDEWGNPNEEQYYKAIRAYSPYDNVQKQAYPPMLVTTGLYDSQVQYWEPAKWVARLRDMKTNDAPLLLETNMEAGHGGASGRDEGYREIAFDFAFLIDLANK